MLVLQPAWKDARPDIPILKEAKAEYAKLQLAENLSATLRFIDTERINREWLHQLDRVRGRGP